MGWYSGGYGGFAPYVSVAQRRTNAVREIKKMQAKGRPTSPVELAGRKIAETFWGKGWCEHMESFRDYENRLPRGRTYVRNGSVVDLQIMPGKITALVAGSSLYEIKVSVNPLEADRWAVLKSRCSGKIASVLELLKGGVSGAVMEVMTDREAGMFPKPGEIKMNCSCPDMAGMCKHLAAVFYGVGARLDREPELLFRLRRVDPAELIAQATGAMSVSIGTNRKVIADSALSDVFGIELEAAQPNPRENAPVETAEQGSRALKKRSAAPSSAIRTGHRISKAKEAKRPVFGGKTNRKALEGALPPKAKNAMVRSRRGQAPQHVA